MGGGVGVRGGMKNEEERRGGGVGVCEEEDGVLELRRALGLGGVYDRPVWLAVCRSVCLSVCRSVCRSVCLSVCLSVCVSVCLLVCMFVCLCLCLSVCLWYWLCYFLNLLLSVPNNRYITLINVDLLCKSISGLTNVGIIHMSEFLTISP